MNNCGLEVNNKLLKEAVGVNSQLVQFFQSTFNWIRDVSSRRSDTYVNRIIFELTPTIPPKMWVEANYFARHSKIVHGSPEKDFHIFSVILPQPVLPQPVCIQTL